MTLVAPLSSDVTGVITPTVLPVVIKRPHREYLGRGAKGKHARRDKRPSWAYGHKYENVSLQRRTRLTERALKATMATADEYDGLEDEVVDELIDMWFRDIERKLGRRSTGITTQSQNFDNYAPELEDDREYNMEMLESATDNVVPIHEAKGYVDMMRYCSNLRGAKRYA